MKKTIVYVLCICSLSLMQAQKTEKVFPGIWKVTYGQPEKHLPTEFKEAPAVEALQVLGEQPEPDFVKGIRFRQATRGAVGGFSIDKSEKIYGFGLQSNTFQQRGLRREIRINDNVVGKIGFGHASLPFFISSKGYGVLVNTARYTTFYMTNQRKLNSTDGAASATEPDRASAASPEELYNRLMNETPNEVEFVVDGSQGMEVYIFAGPSVREVVQRYNLFSGSGAIPPLWSMGLKYRAKNTFNDQQVLQFMKYFRENEIPCDMFGLEPGWHTAAYSCSYVWNPKNFPNPDSLLQVAQGMNYKLNLWEHAFVHPTSPIFNDIVPYSGDYTVWRGAVPDFTLPEARKIFSDYHEKTFVKNGITGFKLDECDNSFQNAASELTFPDISKFPSGIDGEQYRQLFGLLYQKTLLDMYRRNNRRTLIDVRASYMFATPYSSSIYTDMYAHQDYVRMILNSGFSGLNYSPELRNTTSDADLIRRLQTTLMSAHMLVNCWFLSNPPWFQYNTEKNNSNELLPNYKELEQKAKKWIELRMSLIPYLYSAFAKYHYEGIPPFRSLIMDFPDEKDVWTIEDQYMMGDNLMCAPFLDGASTRKVYFPEGVWYDFNTNKAYEGGKSYEISMTLDEIPLFVKDGTILPLAKPVQYITPQTVFDITCHVYGNPTQAALLFEDDGYTFDFEKGDCNRVELTWDASKKKNNGKVVRLGKNKKQLYKINNWIKNHKDKAKIYEETVRNRMLDKKATLETVALYDNLGKLSQKHVLFGHQAATEYGMDWSGDADRSDVKDATGSHPAVVGHDFEGFTLAGQDVASVKAEQDRLARLISEQYNRGGVVTISWHFPNPIKGGKYSFYWDKESVPTVSEIIPGGAYHETYKEILSRAGDFAHLVRGAKGEAVPMIFRPYHEFDGDWFWWGKGHTSKKDYINLWKFTVSYLRDSLNVHNFIYAFSPDCGYNSEADYLKWYPGDEWVDMVGVDNYYDFGRSANGSLEAGIHKLQIVSDYAKRHNKLAAFTETGLENVPDTTWWTNKLLKALKNSDVNMTYALVWCNAGPKHYHLPPVEYPGHANFMEFYNDPYPLFANDLSDIYVLKPDLNY